MPWKLATTQKTQHNNATANGQTDNQRQTNSQPTPALLLFQATNVEPDSKKTTTKTYTKKSLSLPNDSQPPPLPQFVFFTFFFFFISLPSALFCGPEASHLRLTPRRHHFQTTPVVARGSPPNGGSAAAAPCEAPPPAGAPSSAPGGTELFQLAGAWALLLPWVWAWASRALGQPCSAGTAPRTSACGSLGWPAPPLQQPSASTRRRRSPRTGCSRRPLPAGCSATARTP